MTDTAAPSPTPVGATAARTTYAVILAVSLCHLLNDVMQSLLAAIYPMLKADYALDFWQIGLLTLTFQVTASLLQPVIGLYTDKNPWPQSLSAGMASSACGLFLLAYASTYPLLLMGAGLIGLGSAVFHPEASRVARVASGGRYGLAQSLFQVGGTSGTAIGPLLAAFIVVPRGQSSVAWFSLAALLGMIALQRVGAWYERHRKANGGPAGRAPSMPLSRNKTLIVLGLLAMLVFTKSIYSASINSYYTFFLIERFGLSVQQSQMMLFLFLAAMALGTMLGGPLGDRIGAKGVIWFSILGVLPFTLLLPYADLFWSGVLSVAIGVIIAAAFPAIIVFAQELMPGRIGMVAGIFYGFSFGMGGIAAALLGVVADARGIVFVYHVCAWLPFLGLLAVFLPGMKELRRT